LSGRVRPGDPLDISDRQADQSVYTFGSVLYSRPVRVDDVLQEQGTSDQDEEADDNERPNQFWMGPARF